MSMTSTEPSHAISEIALLAAYEVHHTGTEDEQRAIDEIHSESSTQEQTDGNWLTGYRGVPIYRSTNRQADYWDRAAGTNRVEGAFVVTAFFGLYINAAITRIWRKTGGRISDRIFRYAVGGEW